MYLVDHPCFKYKKIWDENSPILSPFFKLILKLDGLIYSTTKISSFEFALHSELQAMPLPHLRIRLPT